MYDDNKDEQEPMNDKKNGLNFDLHKKRLVTMENKGEDKVDNLGSLANMRRFRVSR